ncbi:hypothetical protein [Paraburkholderia aromaticivorans]|nr:hypothetical protein [Paraburkholderia aromaticivorans]
MVLESDDRHFLTAYRHARRIGTAQGEQVAETMDGAEVLQRASIS